MADDMRADGRGYAVTEEGVAAGLLAGRGRYDAECGGRSGRSPLTPETSTNTETTPDVKSLSYGYVRVPPDLADDDVRRIELGMRALADSHGLRLVGFFSEFQPGYYGVFGELITELRRSGARHVVVPSLDHLSRNPYLQTLLVMRLAREADAQLWVVEPAGEQTQHG